MHCHVQTYHIPKHNASQEKPHRYKDDILYDPCIRRTGTSETGDSGQNSFLLNFWVWWRLKSLIVSLLWSTVWENRSFHMLLVRQQIGVMFTEVSLATAFKITKAHIFWPTVSLLEPYPQAYSHLCKTIHVQGINAAGVFLLCFVLFYGNSNVCIAIKEQRTLKIIWIFFKIY